MARDAFQAPFLAVYLQYGPKRDSWNNECKLRSLQNMKVEGDRGEEKENASKHNLQTHLGEIIHVIREGGEGEVIV